MKKAIGGLCLAVITAFCSCTTNPNLSALDAARVDYLEINPGHWCMKDKILLMAAGLGAAQAEDVSAGNSIVVFQTGENNLIQDSIFSLKTSLPSCLYLFADYGVSDFIITFRTGEKTESIKIVSTERTVNSFIALAQRFSISLFSKYYLAQLENLPMILDYLKKNDIQYRECLTTIIHPSIVTNIV